MKTENQYKIEPSARCAVIGHGSWATAIVKILCDTAQHVTWFVRNTEVCDSLRETGRNCRYLSDVEFDTTQLTITDDINTAFDQANVVILATPSAYLKNILEPLTISLDNKFIVSAIKGIIAGEYVTVVEYIHQIYNVPFSRIGIISGPTHAEEVALERLSYLTVVSSNQENGAVLGAKLSARYIQCSYSTDLYGVEYGAILKNIYAVAVGIASGLGYGDNFLAVLISNSACELTRFLEQSYAAPRNTCQSVYLGDLLVTCYSAFSRNRRLGLLLSKGIGVKNALNEMTMVAEGYFAADCIQHINRRHNVDMPIATMVYNILYKNASARRSMRDLITKLV